MRRSWPDRRDEAGIAPAVVVLAVVVGTVAATAIPATGARAAGVPQAAAPAPAQAWHAVDVIDDRIERAYGWQLGDIVRRDVTLRWPRGIALDRRTLPTAGVPGGRIELRRLQWTEQPTGRDGDGGYSQGRLLLDYQVMESPPTPAIRELPVVELAWHPTDRPREPAAGAAPARSAPAVASVPLAPSSATGPGTPMTVAAVRVRLDAVPIAVAPMLPPEGSTLRGLGAWQPALAPVPLDTRGIGVRLGAWTAIATWLAATLAILRWLWPRWTRGSRPFAAAARAVARLERGAGLRDPDGTLAQGLRLLHGAVDRAAGRVLQRADLSGWLATRVELRPHAAALDALYATSERLFFDPGAARSVDAAGAWRDLRTLLRTLARAEDRAA